MTLCQIKTLPIAEECLVVKLLLDRGAGCDRASTPNISELALSAHGFDNEGGLSPHLKLNRGTARDEIAEAERNLSPLVDQRFTIMHHTQGIDAGAKGCRSRSILGEVAISNDL